MNSEPCVRLGMSISPKISAKPDENRNSRPPKAMLFAASSQRFMPPDASALERRIVARVDRLRQEPLLLVGPELADVLVGLDRRVDELAVLALAAPDVEVATTLPKWSKWNGPRGVSVRLTPRIAAMKASLSSVLPPVFSSVASATMPLM